MRRTWQWFLFLFEKDRTIPRYKSMYWKILHATTLRSWGWWWFPGRLRQWMFETVQAARRRGEIYW